MKTFHTDNLPSMDATLQQLIYNGLDGMLTLEVDAAIPHTPTYEFERSLLPLALTLMQRGILIDLEKRDSMIEHLRQRLAKIQQGFDFLCWEVLGCKVNPRSYPQMQDLLYKKLLLPEVISSKKGEKKISTDRDALERLGRDYVRARPFAEHLLRIRDLEKTIDALTKHLSPSGRWHANFNIAGTDTGRWSSSSHPFGWGSNLQNLDDYVRRIFIPDPGHLFFNCDQQGAEARVVGYLAGDGNYIKAVESGDVHTMVAAMVFGFEPKRELADRKYYREMSFRDIAKRAAHGSNYGGTAHTIARVLKVETQIIEEFQKKYFATFPNIYKWQVWVQQRVQQERFLVTPFGRRRNFWDNPRDDATIRAAIAFVPQSTVGDLTSRGLLALHSLPHVQVLNNIHDAAFGQIPIHLKDELLPRIIETLTFPLRVTDIWGNTREMLIPWESQTGMNWGKRKKDNPDGLA
jgi:DNA polymerase I-like protein with 3'-5' exonuclease and polymerase domains